MLAFLVTVRLCVAADAVAADAAPVEMLRNGNFESKFQPQGDSGKARLSGELARAWSDDSAWADVEAVYKRDTTGAHGGLAAQRIDVKEVKSGALQLRQTVQNLVPGHEYSFRIWLRGKSAAPVVVFLQQTDAPYEARQARLVQVSSKWTPVTLSFVPQAGQSEIAAMIRLSEPGTVWIDDARFVEGALPVAPEANWEAAPDNLLPNGSFEAGLSGGWGIISDNSLEESTPQIDASAAHEGKSSLRIRVLPPAPHLPATVMSAHSPAVPIVPNLDYTASIWIKADKPDSVVSMGLDDAGEQQWVSVGTEWQRFSITRRPSAKTTRFSFGCYLSRDTTLWFDGAQLQAGAQPSPEYLPQSPVELDMSTSRAGHVFYDGEDARLTVRTGAQALPPGARLRSQLFDVYGARTKLPDVRLPAPQLVIAPDAKRPRGLFKVRAQVVDARGGALSPPVEIVWARVPRPRELAPEDSFFGTHFLLTPEYSAIARAVGMRWVRIHDSSRITKWATAEPNQGDFRFYDQAVDQVRSSGMRILGMLDGAPAWANARHDIKPEDFWMNHYALPDAPGALESWKRYVQTMTGHYKGRIDYWEVWNEPWNANPPFFTGTPQFYGELLKAAYPAAKEGNAQSVVIGIDTYPVYGDHFTEGAMKASGPAFYDVFSYHDYFGALKVGPNPAAQQFAQQFHAMQEKYGAVKPVWITEGSPVDPASFYFPAGDVTILRKHASDFVRFYVSTMSTGAQKFFLYGMFGHSLSGGFNSHLEHDHAIRVSLVACAHLASLVDGLPPPVRREPVGGVDAYEFRAAKGNITVLWNYNGETATVAPPPKTRVFDMFGNLLSGPKAATVSSEPIYWVN